MWNKRMCLGTSSQYPLGIDEQIRLFHTVGFCWDSGHELNTKSKPGRHENDKYALMPIEQYITEAYCRACRVASKL